MAEERDGETRYEVRSKRPPYLVAELALFKDHQPLLERCARGTTQLYLTLLSYVNHLNGHPNFGYAWPSQKLLCRLLDFQERQIRYCLATLKDLGYISIKRRGLMKTNLIVIETLPSLEEVNAAIEAMSPSPQRLRYEKAREKLNEMIEEWEKEELSKKQSAS